MIATTASTTRFDAAEVHAWWRELRPDPERRRRGDAGALADLRRCTTPAEVPFVPAFHLLRRRLPGARPNDLAVVAAVVAHIRDHDGSSRVAQQMASERAPKQPTVSPLRFRRILQMEGPEARLRQGARIVRHLSGSVNLEDLARSLYQWDANPDVHAEWANGYYGALSPDHLKKS